MRKRKKKKKKSKKRRTWGSCSVSELETISAAQEHDRRRRGRMGRENIKLLLNAVKLQISSEPTDIRLLLQGGKKSCVNSSF